MANILRGGFRPVEAHRFQVRMHSLASAYAPANSCLGVAVGEVVALLTDGTLKIADAGDAALLYGIVKSTRYVGGDGRPVYGGVVPTGHTFTGNANVSNPLAPKIEVWVLEPGLELEACVATASTNALAYAGVGANMDLSATSATTVSTVTRESLRTLDGTYVAGTAQMRILQIVPDPVNDVTAANYRVRCCVNEGFASPYSTAGI